ncbi:TPA: hypothetical protein ACGUQA_004594 [Vibrio vulnificus]
MSNELSTKEIIHEYRVAIQGVKTRLNPVMSKSNKKFIIKWFVVDTVYVVLMEALDKIDRKLRK